MRNEEVVVMIHRDIKDDVEERMLKRWRRRGMIHELLTMNHQP